MGHPKTVTNLIAFANAVDRSGQEDVFRTLATIITPDEQIELIFPSGMSTFAAFGARHSDDSTIIAQLQPGVYLNKVLPHRDNLFIEVVKRAGYSQVMTRYRAYPLGDSNPAMIGTHTELADMNAKDSLNIVDVRFQLIDPGFAILMHQPVSDHHLMSDLATVLYHQLISYGERLQLTGADQWKGVDIEYPIDNDRVFPQVIIPSSIPLIKLASYLQNDDRFGIYSKGLGSYYRKGMWYIYPLLNMNRYPTARKVANIYRLPTDVFPSLRRTWFLEGKVLTILGQGEGSHVDGTDMIKVNKGSGKRVTSSDALAGEVGYYYKNGIAVTTRADSVSEYKTSERASKEENIPFHGTPTSNMCKLLSENAFADGTMVTLEWQNSAVKEIIPCMAMRYYYMDGSDALVYKEGVILGYKSEDVRENKDLPATFREYAILHLFISNDTQPG